MEFEIHVTVSSKNVLSFINDCQEINVKPIVIETEKEGVFNNQVMTSSKHKDKDYKEILSKISKQLVDKGYDIIRQKVEIRPLHIKNDSHIYYESHLRLKLPKSFDRTILQTLCKKMNFHLLKNLFKRSIDFDYQMITYRNNNIDFERFNEIIYEMRQELIKLNINSDKVEIEECVFDSNILVDKNWI